MSGHPCQAKVLTGHRADWYRCGKTDDKKPMVFRGTYWCCGDHRKLVVAQSEVAK